MSIPFRAEDGTIIFMAMSINCKEVEIKRADTYAIEYIKCIAKTIKPECSDCSILNPHMKKFCRRTIKRIHGRRRRECLLKRH